MKDYPILKPACLPMSLALVASCFAATDAAAQNKPQQNVLFIIVDDLRPEMECYGAKAIAPNIDALVASGVRFQNAYCNIPVSGASRASLLTGTRPTRDAFLIADTRADVDKPEIISINEHFKASGYKTISQGKVFHNPKDHAAGWDKIERNEARRYMAPINLDIIKNGTGKRGYAYECFDAPDDAYTDGETALNAMKDLEQLSREGTPFFYALGFTRPHLPFIAPKKYWDMYDYDKIQVPDNYIMPDGNGIPMVAWPTWGELRNYDGIPEKPNAVPVDTARKLIHGYHAAVSFTDAQIGRVVNKLRELGLDKNTAIVLVGDHGWSLGEHGVWCKHSVFETNLHAPMIVSDPSAKVKGYFSNEIVEFVDLFPTMCDMARIEKPAHLEGETLLPLLSDKKAKHKGYAISRWDNGFTIVTPDNMFYTEWWDAKDNVTDRLLFDHNVDPAENKNLADNPQYAELINKLSAELKANRGANFDKYERKKHPKEY